MHRHLWTGLVVLGLVGGAAAQPTAGFDATVVRVVDGDSVWARRSGAASAPLRLRLVGVDAPEICQAHGPASRDALAARLALGGHRVQVRLLGQDRYGRWLAQLQTADGDVASWLVAQGLAWNDGAYARQERDAKRGRLGLFAQRDPEPPRDFRRRHGPCEVPRPSAEQRVHRAVFSALRSPEPAHTGYRAPASRVPGAQP